MSLTVKSLNGDTTFLLTFSSPIAPATTSFNLVPGSFTILLDPWLSGCSEILSPKFHISHHTVQPCISSLADLPEPDLLIISQDKPDHCHRETLTQLPSNIVSTILATPAAASKIRGWRHFDPECVKVLDKYDSRDASSVTRIPVPPISPSGLPGEVTIANLPAKLDLSGLHNAIGITYRAPSSALTTGYTGYLSVPLTPPATPPSLVRSESPSMASSQAPSFAYSDTSKPPKTSSAPMRHNHDKPTLSDRPYTSPASSVSTVRRPLTSLNRERTLSVLYSPHGVSYSVIQPYASSHLVAEAALPLSALFHSFDRVSNPWYLGGTVIAGGVGGVEIAKNLIPRVWIGAHDEDKEKRGFSTAQLKVEKYTVDDVKSLLESTGISMKGRAAPNVLSLQSDTLAKAWNATRNMPVVAPAPMLIEALSAA